MQVNTTATKAIKPMKIVVLRSISANEYAGFMPPHKATEGSGNSIWVIPSWGANASNALSIARVGNAEPSSVRPLRPSAVPIPSPRKTTMSTRLPK